MKRTILLAATLILLTPTVHAQTTQPVSKRAVVAIGSRSTVQATALTARTSTAEAIIKDFFVAYGGQVSVDFMVRSNGTHTVNWEARFGNESFAPCSGSTSSATYQGFGCGSSIGAGEVVRVIVFPTSGQQAAICCARLKFNLVNVNTPAVTLKD